MSRADRRILMIAGPNGAGKTTFAREYLPQEADCPVFVNADLIAAGLSPFRPDAAALRAGRLMLSEISRYADAGVSFGFETTLAGRGYAQRIPIWQKAGYRVKLIFLHLDRPETAIARVAERVRQGGHSVPEAVIRRRFHAGKQNFSELYRKLVDSWALYNNSGERPTLIDWSSDHDESTD